MYLFKTSVAVVLDPGIFPITKASVASSLIVSKLSVGLQLNAEQDIMERLRNVGGVMAEARFPLGMTPRATN